jgi:DNA polymerase V
MLNDFSPNGVSQLNLFDDVQPRPHSDALMKVLDGINHSGLGKSGLPAEVLLLSGR